jgi:hypothetical protein
VSGLGRVLLMGGAGAAGRGGALREPGPIDRVRSRSTSETAYPTEPRNRLHKKRTPSGAGAPACAREQPSANGMGDGRHGSSGDARRARGAPVVRRARAGCGSRSAPCDAPADRW